MSNPEDTQSCTESTIATFGRLDCLVSYFLVYDSLLFMITLFVIVFFVIAARFLISNYDCVNL